MTKNIVYIILCVFLYSCNSGKNDSCQTCKELKSHTFEFTFLFPKNLEETYDYEDFCQYPDYYLTDVIVLKEKEKEWEDSRVKVCINLDSLSTIPSPVSEYLDDVQKYILTSKECKRKILAKNKKTIAYIEYLDRENNVLTLISYCVENNFLIRKKILIEQFKTEDYELIAQLLLG